MKLQIVNPKSKLVRRPYGGIAVILAESFGLSALVLSKVEGAKNLKSQIETCPPSVWRNRKSKITFLTSLFVLLTSIFSTPAFAGSIVAWGEPWVGVDLSGGFVKVDAGEFHSLGLKQDGSIVAWGRNRYGQCNIPSPNSGFIAIAVGGYHSLGLKQDGSIVAWGSNSDGQCNIPEPNSGFIAISAGGNHSLGLKQDGSIVAWGRNYEGQCNIPSPNSGFIAIAAGAWHSLGLKQDSSIVAWGLNDDGQCNVPSPNSGFIAISTGGYHSLAIKKKVCQYKLTGDLDDNCRVGWEDVRIFTGQWLDSDGSANLDGFNGINLLDFALLADNWLIDCEIEPHNPACIPK